MDSDLGLDPVRPPPAVRPLSLRRNCLWSSLGSGVDMLCQWGRVVLLAHLGSLEMIGALVLAYAICAPVFALAGLGLRTAAVTDAKHEYQFADYLALRLVCAGTALLVIVGIVVIGYQGETAAMILLVGLCELLRSVGEIFHAVLQQHERLDRTAISLMIQGLASLLLLALGVWLTGSLLWGILGHLLVTATVLLGYDLPNGWRVLRISSSPVWPRWELHRLLRLAWLAAPLGVILTMVALATSIPRFTVSHYLGNGQLGIFVSIYYLGMIGARIVTALVHAAGPRLAKYYAAGNRAAYLRLLAKLAAVVAVVGAAGVLAVALLGELLLGLLYRADYSPWLGLAVYLMLAAAMTHLSVLLGVAVEAMRRFKTHMVIRGAGILLLLVLSPGLIQAWGLHGQASAILLSSLAIMAGCAAVILTGVRRLAEVA